MNNINLNYEMKLFLKPDIVLDTNNQLQESVVKEFNLNSLINMGILYLDTNNLELDNLGWNVRVRKKDDSKSLELNYKKRFPVIDDNLELAINNALADGFGASNEEFEAELDCGFSKKTLSFSYKAKVKDLGLQGTEVPNEDKCIELAKKYAPSKFNELEIDLLSKSRIHGPVLAIREKGLYEGLELTIEIWNVINEDKTGFENIVEVSFKTDNELEAFDKHSKLIKLLDDKGWFLPMDKMKTQIILDRY